MINMKIYIVYISLTSNLGLRTQSGNKKYFFKHKKRVFVFFLNKNHYFVSLVRKLHRGRFGASKLIKKNVFFVNKIFLWCTLVNKNYHAMSGSESTMNEGQAVPMKVPPSDMGLSLEILKDR